MKTRDLMAAGLYSEEVSDVQQRKPKAVHKPPCTAGQGQKQEQEQAEAEKKAGEKVKFVFTIPGKPCGKQRPKFGAGRTYTPEKTVNYENLVKLRFKQKYPDIEPIAAKVPITARITAYYPIPASTTKKKLEDIKKGLARPTSKPDTDNIAKICLDALNGIAYHDDAQIVRLIVEKWYSAEPCVRIEIAEW